MDTHATPPEAAPAAAQEDPIARLDAALQHYSGLVAPHTQAEPAIAAVWSAVHGLVSELQAILAKVVQGQLRFGDDQVETLTALCHRCGEVVGALKADEPLERDHREALAGRLSLALSRFMADFFPYIGLDPAQIQEAIAEAEAEAEAGGNGQDGPGRSALDDDGAEAEPVAPEPAP